jgi:cell wall assembly regulator SMI1
MNDVQRSFSQLLTALAAANRPVLSHLRPGLSQQEIDRQCQVVGVVLPAELSALYQFCDGVEASGPDSDFCLCSYYFLMPLSMALKEYQMVKEVARYDEEINPNWFPFLSGEGDLYLLDPEAASAGKASIICYMREFWPCTEYLSLSTMFDTLTDCYQQGAYGPPGEPEKDDCLLIARLSAAKNPGVLYWQEQLQAQLNKRLDNSNAPDTVSPDAPF